MGKQKPKYTGLSQGILAKFDELSGFGEKTEGLKPLNLKGSLMGGMQLPEEEESTYQKINDFGHDFTSKMKDILGVNEMASAIEGVGSEAATAGQELGKGLYQMKKESDLTDLLIPAKGLSKINGNVSKGSLDLAKALLHGAMSTFTVPYAGTESIVNKGLDVNLPDPITGQDVNLGKTITGTANQLMNLPFDVIRQGSEGITKLLGIEPAKEGSVESKANELLTELGGIVALGKLHKGINKVVDKTAGKPIQQLKSDVKEPIKETKVEEPVKSKRELAIERIKAQKQQVNSNAEAIKRMRNEGKTDRQIAIALKIKPSEINKLVPKDVKQTIEIPKESKTVVEDLAKIETPPKAEKLTPTETAEPQSPVKGTEVKQEGKEAVKEEIKPLIEEAKKYKSADEFVKAQRTTNKDTIKLYRGMENKFDPNYDLTKTDAPNGYSTWTHNPELAKQYGSNIYEIELPKKQQGKELVNADGERVLFLDNEKKAGLNNISGKEYLVYNDHEMYNSNLVKEFKTKSQLTDIWNKANPVGKEAIKVSEVEPVNQPEIISKEAYLTKNGATFMKGAEPALHKNIQEGRGKKQAINKVMSEMEANNKRREELRLEYKEKVNKGEIRPPTRTEKLIETANGHEDLEATQAARRILDKQGVNWDSPSKDETVEPESKTKQSTETEKPAGKLPHEMTRNKYIKSGTDEFKVYGKVVKQDYEYFLNEHRKLVEQALSEGKPVPEEVLKDYPELKQEAQPQGDNLPAVKRMLQENKKPSEIMKALNIKNSEFQTLRKQASEEIKQEESKQQAGNQKRIDEIKQFIFETISEKNKAKGQDKANLGNEIKGYVKQLEKLGEYGYSYNAPYNKLYKINTETGKKELQSKPIERSRESVKNIKPEDFEIQYEESKVRFEDLDPLQRKEQEILSEAVKPEMLPNGIGKKVVEKGLQDIREDSGKELSKEAQIVRDAALKIRDEGFIDKNGEKIEAEEVMADVENIIKNEKTPLEIAQQKLKDLQDDPFADDNEIEAARKKVEDLQGKEDDSFNFGENLTKTVKTENVKNKLETKFIGNAITTLNKINNGKGFLAVAPNGLKPTEIAINETVVIAGGNTIREIATEAKKLGLSDETHTIYQVVPNRGGQPYTYDYSIDNNASKKRYVTTDNEVKTDSQRGRKAYSKHQFKQSKELTKGITQFDRENIITDRMEIEAQRNRLQGLVPSDWTVEVKDLGTEMAGLTDGNKKTVALNSRGTLSVTEMHELAHVGLLSDNRSDFVLKLNGWDGKGAKNATNGNYVAAHEKVAEKFSEYSKNRDKFLREAGKYAKMYDAVFQKMRAFFRKAYLTFKKNGKMTEAQFFEDLYNGKLSDTFNLDVLENMSFAQKISKSEMQDYLDISEEHVKSKITDYKKWSEKMIEDLGEDVKPDLKAIWDATKKAYPESFPKAEVKKPVEKKQTTSIKNAVTDVERIERGLDPIEKEARKENEVVWDEAMSKVDKGTIDPQILADEIINNPRNLSDTETGVLLYDRIRLKNAFRETMDKIETAKTPDAEAQLRVELKSIESRIDKNDLAAKKAGTEWGRSGQFRQRIAREDYTLENMVRKYKSASNSKEIPADIRARFEEYDRKIRDLEKQIADFGDRKVRTETTKAFNAIKREADYQLRRENRKITKAELDTEFSNLSKELLKATGQLNVGLDPKAAAIIGKMAVNRAKSGIISVESLVDNIYTGLAEKISKEDIRDAILNYEKDLDITTERKQKAYKTRMQNRINELKNFTQRMVDTGKPVKKEMRETPLNPELLELQGQLSRTKKLYDRELELARRKNRTTKEKWLDIASEIVNLPRSAFMTVADMSAPLRQGKWMTAAHPVLGVKAGKEMVRSFFSPKAYERLEAWVEYHPNQKYIQRHGLDITEIGSFTKREEKFMSTYAEKIPIWGKFVVKPSERAYNAYLNKMRVDVFSQTLKALKENGMDIDSRDAKPKLDALARLINDSSGRGDLGKTLQLAQPILNGVIFSPKNIAGNLRMIGRAFNPKLYKESIKDPVSREAMRQIWSLVGAGTAIVGLAGLAGAEVETDPASSDFMKIKVGNTRLDIWGGLQQYLVYFYRMLGNEIKSTSGKKSELPEKSYPFRTRGTITEDFIKNKFSPQMSLLRGALSDTDDGSYKDFKLDEELDNRIMPLAARDMYLAAQENGLVGGAFSLPAFFGAGLQTFNPEKDAKIRKLEKRIKKIEEFKTKYPKYKNAYDREIKKLEKQIEEIE